MNQDPMLTSILEIVAKLDSEEPRVRGQALNDLLHRGPVAAPAIPKLIDAIRRRIVYLVAWRTVMPNYHVAAVALGSIGAPAHEATLQLLGEDDFWLVYNGVAILENGTAPLPDAIPRLIEFVRAGTRTPRTMPFLDRCSASELGLLRSSAICALGRMQGAAKEALPNFLEQLELPHPNYSVFELLLGIELSQRTLRPLYGIMEDENRLPTYRVKAAMTMAGKCVGDSKRIASAMERLLNGTNVAGDNRRWAEGIIDQCRQNPWSKEEKL